MKKEKGKEKFVKMFEHFQRVNDFTLEDVMDDDDGWIERKSWRGRKEAASPSSVSQAIHGSSPSRKKSSRKKRKKLMLKKEENSSSPPVTGGDKVGRKRHHEEVMDDDEQNSKIDDVSGEGLDDDQLVLRRMKGRKKRRVRVDSDDD